jgi:hypothetical protein
MGMIRSILGLGDDTAKDTSQDDNTTGGGLWHFVKRTGEVLLGIMEFVIGGLMSFVGISSGKDLMTKGMANIFGSDDNSGQSRGGDQTQSQDSGGHWWSWGNLKSSFTGLVDRGESYVAGPIHNNNPGNIRATNASMQAEGAVGEKNGFIVFDNYEHGLKKMSELLIGYEDGSRHLDTVSKIVSHYAPASENPTSTYIQHVSQWTGFGPNEHLDLHNPEVLAKLVWAMTRQEQGDWRARQMDKESILQAAKSATQHNNSVQMDYASVESSGPAMTTPHKPQTDAQRTTS